MILRYKRTWNVGMVALVVLSALAYLAFTVVLGCFGPQVVLQIVASKQWMALILPVAFLAGWGAWTFGMLSLLGSETAVEIAGDEFSLRSGRRPFTTRWRYRLSEIQDAHFGHVGWGLHHLFLEMKDGSFNRVQTQLSANDLRDIVYRVREQTSAATVSQALPDPHSP
jgi:hypothetical protein